MFQMGIARGKVKEADFKQKVEGIVSQLDLPIQVSQLPAQVSPLPAQISPLPAQVSQLPIQVSPLPIQVDPANYPIRSTVKLLI